MTLSIWILDTLQTLEFLTTTELTSDHGHIKYHQPSTPQHRRGRNPSTEAGDTKTPPWNRILFYSGFKNSLNRRERYFSTESYYH